MYYILIFWVPRYIFLGPQSSSDLSGKGYFFVEHKPVACVLLCVVLHQKFYAIAVR